MIASVGNSTTECEGMLNDTRTVLAMFLVSGWLVRPAHAQAADGNISAISASAVIEGCRAHAGAKRQSHAIAVVDAGGGLVAALRMEGNRAGAMEFSIKKAVAVAAWGFPTSGMADGAKETPGFAAAPYVVTVPGGIPIYAADGRRLIGAVGVSGEAPADDVACAQAGVRAAGLRWERASQ
jgi:uncharacterized protein GlcG (DUF336 family)